MESATAVKNMKWVCLQEAKDNQQTLKPMQCIANILQPTTPLNDGVRSAGKPIWVWHGYLFTRAHSKGIK